MSWIKKNIVQLTIMLGTMAVLTRCVGSAVVLNTLGDTENLTVVDDVLLFAILAEVLLFVVLSVKFWRRVLVLIVLGLCCVALSLILLA